MTGDVPTLTQRRAAKIVGATYLCALPPAIFAEFYVLGQLLVSGDATATATNILAHERLFRLAIASNLTVFSLDVILFIALYIVLEPVDRIVALLALGWGLVETAILVVVTVGSDRAQQ